MRNREIVRQMKAYIPPENKGTTQTEQTLGGTKDSLAEKYTPLLTQHPQIGLYLSAIELLQKKNPLIYLSGDEREALLMHSIWTEDPSSATIIAQQVGTNERRLNQYVDLASFELESASEALLQIIQNLQKQMRTSVDATIPSALPMAVSPPAKPLITTEHLSYAQKIAAENLHPSKQTYDHPIHTLEQDLILFEYIRLGSSLEVLVQDERFRATIEAEDLESWGNVLAESSSIRDVITNMTLRFVDVIARAYGNSGLSHSELVSAGNIGVLKAIENYDPSRGAKFTTYAQYAIRREIQNAVQDNKGVHLPSNVHQDLAKVRWVEAAFKVVFEREPTPEELKEQLLANTDLKVRRIDTALEVLYSNLQYPKSINEKLTPDSEDEQADFISDETIDVERAIIDKETQRERRRQVRRAIHEYLTEQERNVIMGLFGLGRELEKNPEELAQEMGLIRDEIEVIRERALGRLRHDEILRAQWDGKQDLPYFVYGASAERAAFKLGLFSERYMELERAKKLFPSSQPQILQLEQNGNYVSTVKPPSEEYESGKPHRMVEITSDGLHSALIPESWNSKTTTEKILFLRDQGLNNKQIAERLGIQIATVWQKAARSRLIQKDSLKAKYMNHISSEDSSENYPIQKNKERTKSLISKVKKLRNQGYGNKEIAEMVGSPYASVAQSAVRLLRKGEITLLPRYGDPAKRSKRTLSYDEVSIPWDKVQQFKDPQDKMSREEARSLIEELRALGINYAQTSSLLGISRQKVWRYLQISSVDVNGIIDSTINSVKELRNQGLNNRRIADSLGIACGTAENYASKLIRRGEIDRLPREKYVISPRTRKPKVVKKVVRSEATEKVREYLEAHPRRSYKDGFTVIFNARERRARRPRGKRPETLEFERQVKELREQGLTHKQIAEKLGTNWMKVQVAAYNLIRAGELESRNPVRKPKERAEKIANNKEFKKRVKELSEKGLNTIQIAETLDDSVHRVWVNMSKMHRAGEITVTREQMHPSNIIGYIDKHASNPASVSGVYEKVATMRNQGMRNGEIAEALGLPKHHVEQYASNLIRAGVIEPGARSSSTAIFKSVKLKPEAGEIKRLRSAPEEMDYLSLKVVELRNQGTGNTEIARLLDQSLERINRLAKIALRAGQIALTKAPASSATEMAQFRFQVKELRDQGFGNEEIAQKLGKNKHLVYKVASEFIKAGQIQSNKLPSLPKQEMEIVIKRVKELRNQGLSNQEIAGQLDQPPERIKRIAKKLIKRGAIKSMKIITGDTNSVLPQEDVNFYIDLFNNLTPGEGGKITLSKDESAISVKRKLTSFAKQRGFTTSYIAGQSSDTFYFTIDVG